MEPDPLLPPEPLPQPWPGTRARALAAQCWDALAVGDDEGPGRLRLFRLYSGTATAAAPAPPSEREEG